MSERLIGMIFPRSSSQKRTYGKRDGREGYYTIKDGKLNFDARFLYLIHMESLSYEIPLLDIVQVEPMKLNVVFPYGVCVFLKDGREIMFGHHFNQKLTDFILTAIEEENRKTSESTEVIS